MVTRARWKAVEKEASRLTRLRWALYRFFTNRTHPGLLRSLGSLHAGILLDIRTGKVFGILEGIPDDCRIVEWGGSVFSRWGSYGIHIAYHRTMTYHTNQKLRPFGYRLEELPSEDLPS